MASAEQAPPVVAVVVTCDPGPWFEETLEALAAQDYPSLSILVVDAASTDDPTPRVAATLPGAYVRRLPSNPGFSGAANEVLHVVEGATHFVFCHDDVAPAPDAVRVMVEEAYRSNAGVVTPKLVDWDDPRRILAVGTTVDKSGAPSPLADRGELDQEQHDGVRDVFVAPGGCTLVRADLFASLGGFDPVMHLYGEDLDLSWRAQIAGARVVVAPSARVRHLEAMSSGRRAPGGGAPPRDLALLRAEVRPLQARHRLRTVLKAYGRWHLVRVLPQVALLALVEIVFGLLSGHRRTALDTAAAWRWNAGRLSELRQARAAVQRTRLVADGEVRRLMARGSARFKAFVRGQLAAERMRRRRPPGHRPRPIARALGPGSARLSFATGLAVAVVLAIGSRHLVTRGLPAVHELAPFPDSPFAFLRGFLSGWRQVGVGSDDPAPFAFALLGLGGVALGGAMGLLQTLLVLGMLPLGLVGVSRLASAFRSRRAKVAALVVYAAIPLPYNAIAAGELGGVVAYGTAPWILAALFASTRLAPFDPAEAVDPRRRLVGLGVLLALVAAFVPAMVVTTVFLAVCLVLGSLLAGQPAAAARSLAVALAGGALAAVVLLPWTFDFVLPGTHLSALLGVAPPSGTGSGFGALMRFETGPLGAPPLGWAFAVTAAFPLLIGRGWRLEWAVRLWTLAVGCWGLSWAAGRGLLPAPPVEVLLAPAAVAVALTVAVGMVAFEGDLSGYRFGWRHAASTATLVVTLLGTLPVLAGAVGGRWGSPRDDLAGLLSWMEDERRDGPFRVLWLGDPRTLPLRSWRLADGVGYALSKDGFPDATALWTSGSPGAAQLVADSVNVARRAGTAHLGHLLAPAAVRYIVVPERAAPSARRLPAPLDVEAALDTQVDLARRQDDDVLAVYENAAWAPALARIPDAAVEAAGAGGLRQLATVELAGSRPVLAPGRSPTRFSGRLDAGAAVLLSEAASSRWELQVGGRAAPREKAFGWANLFVSPATGRATLRYRTSPLRWALLGLEAALWIALVRPLVRRRSRIPPPPPPPPVAVAEPEPVGVGL